MTTVRQLREIVLTALASQNGLQVFDGEPDSGLKSLGYGAGNRTDVIIDPDGRAHMHAALYLGIGRPDDERACGGHGAVNDTFQVTAVGGDSDRCLRAIEKVQAALEGLHVTGSGRISQDDFDPGPMPVDPEPPPSRTYLPMTFRVLL